MRFCFFRRSLIPSAPSLTLPRLFVPRSQKRPKLYVVLPMKYELSFGCKSLCLCHGLARAAPLEDLLLYGFRPAASA